MYEAIIKCSLKDCQQKNSFFYLFFNPPGRLPDPIKNRGG
jgi:hypothetical protein